MVLTVDGRRIGYDDTQGSGIPLVLIHDLALDRTTWDDVAETLVGTRVIRIDLRGCGESERGDGPALMELLAGDVAAVLDALGVENAAIVGHGAGGCVALVFFRMYAERVAGLGLLACDVAADAPARAAARAELASRLESEGTMDAAIDVSLQRLFAPHVYRDRPELVDRVRALIAQQDARGCAQLARGMQQRLAADDLLAGVRVPTLVLAGRHDSIVAAASLRAAAGEIGDARFIELDEAGHLPQLESPQATADALAELAARVRDDARR